MQRRAYFISDIHLENMEELNGQNLLRFFRYLALQDTPCDLYLLGDIFDLWLSDHKVFVKKFAPLLVPLKQLKEKGSRLVYFEGNHDLHLKPFWKDQMGFHVYKKAHYENIGELKVRIEHGDLINLDDQAYLKWKAFTQNPFSQFLAHSLPGSFWNWLGSQLSKKSRDRSHQFRLQNEEEIKDMIRIHGKRSFLEKPFDLIITGHMHVKVDEVFDVDGKIIRNINLGTWRGEETEPPILCIEGSDIHWIKT